MRRWDQRLVRLLRALLACTVLLFAAHTPAVASEPVRDVSAWIAVQRVPALAAASVQRARAPRAANVSAAEPTAPRWARASHAPAPAAARRAPDQRRLYLDLQTLRC